MLYFTGKLCKQVSGKLEHKLQAAVPVLCWCFFNLNEKTVVKKRKIPSFLITKMYDIILSAAFSETMFDEAGTTCLNKKRYSK